MKRRFTHTSEKATSCSLPLVAAVTVNWNGLPDTIECVASLRHQSYDNLEVIVVDNASTGDDVARLAERFGDSVTVVCNETNLGCAGGYNSGIQYARTHSRPDYILAINNDVVADVDMVAALVHAAESDPTTGLIGPKIYYYDWNGRTDIIWSSGGHIHRWGLKIHSQRGDGEPDEGQFDTMEEVDWISG
ncbi:MAG: glycosyltransferase family 2 protein, partial [Chloroflexota bacterium]